jgi:hypothetical protein
VCSFVPLFIQFDTASKQKGGVIKSGNISIVIINDERCLLFRHGHNSSHSIIIIAQSAVFSPSPLFAILPPETMAWEKKRTIKKPN